MFILLFLNTRIHVFLLDCPLQQCSLRMKKKHLFMRLSNKNQFLINNDFNV